MKAIDKELMNIEANCVCITKYHVIALNVYSFLFKQQQSRNMSHVGHGLSWAEVRPLYLLGRDLLRISFFCLVLFSILYSGSCVKPLHQGSLCNILKGKHLLEPIGQQFLFGK